MLYRECQLRSFRILSLTIFVCLSLFLAACGHSTATFLAKGEEYLQKRKFHDALMQFRSAAESDPNSSDAHWGLARAHENLAQFNETLDELRKVVELDDSNLAAKAKLGSYFLLVQPPMIAEAEKLRSEILQADPNFIEGYILSASIMAAQGKPDAEIIAIVNGAIDRDPQRIESYISLERLYMTRKKAAEAEQAIKLGIAANPASIAGYTEYGRFLMYSARNDEAEAQFNKAIEIDPASIEAREALAEFFVSSRQLAKAEQAYFDLVKVQENSPESRLVLAEFYSKAHRDDEAIETLNKIIADFPEYVLARYKVSQMYLDRKDAAKVNEQLEALFKINDVDNEALMLRARLRLQENKGEEAVKDVEEVLKRRPSNREALFLIAQAKLSLGQVDQANPFITDLGRYHPNYLRAGLLKIQAAVAAGDSQNALKFANELVDRANAATPNADLDSQEIVDLRSKGISARGIACLDLGKLADARAAFEEVARLSPRSVSAILNLAKVSIAEGDRDAAQGLYEKALAIDPANFDAISGSVSNSIRLRRTAQAHARIDGSIAGSAGKADVLAALHYLRSTVFAAEKNTAAAEKELLASIELDENYLPAYSTYAGLLAEQNRIDEAVEQYRKVLEKGPAAQVYTLLGILEDSRGNSSEAERCYRKALELAPDSSIAANNLAWLIADGQGNLDEALQLASMAITRNPNVAGFYDTLGWVYFKKELISPAVEQFKKAVAMEDASSRKTGAATNQGFRVRLGMALAKAGDKSSAKREVETSLKSSELLSQREVNDAKAVLASL